MSDDEKGIVMKFQCVLFVSLFACHISWGSDNGIFNNDRYSKKSYFAVVKDISDKINDYNNDQRNDNSRDNQDVERQENRQERDASSAGNDRQQERLDRIDHDSRSDHERSMAIESRHDYFREKNNECNAGKEKYCCDFLKKGSFEIWVDLVKDRSRIIYPTKFIHINNSARSMISTLGLEQKFNVNIEQFGKKEQSLFSLANDLLNKSSAMFCAGNLTPGCLLMAEVAILCAISYDLTQKGEIRSVPELLQVGHVTIAKYNEYCMHCGKMSLVRSRDVARAPHVFVWDQIKGLAQGMCYALRVVGFMSRLKNGHLSAYAELFQGIQSVAKRADELSNEIARMSADELDMHAKMMIKVAAEIIVDSVLSAGILHCCPKIFTSLSKLLNVKRASEIQQFVMPAQRYAECIVMVWDETLGTFVMQEGKAYPVVSLAKNVAPIMSVTQKIALPAVRGPQIIGLAPGVQVSTLFARGAVISKVPLAVTAAVTASSGASQAGPTIEKIAEVAIRTVEDILSECTRWDQAKGATRQYSKAGSFQDVLKDFESLLPANVRNVSEGERICFTGNLSDGQMLVARNSSKSFGPTLEIQYSKSKVIKIRYI